MAWLSELGFGMRETIIKPRAQYNKSTFDVQMIGSCFGNNVPSKLEIEISFNQINMHKNGHKRENPVRINISVLITCIKNLCNVLRSTRRWQREAVRPPLFHVKCPWETLEYESDNAKNSGRFFTAESVTKYQV